MEIISADDPHPPSSFFFLGRFLLSFIQPLSIEIIPAFIAVVCLIIGSALVSGSEVAYFSLRPKQIRGLRKTPGSAASRVVRLMDRPKRLLATILIANNLFNIALILTSYYLTSQLFDFGGNVVIDFVVNTVLITFILVLFGEVIPKVYANKYNEKLATFTSALLLLLSRIFYPFSTFLVNSTQLIEKKIRSKSSEIDLEEIDKAIDIVADDGSNAKDITMLKSIVKFGNITVKQIMRARVDVVAVEKNASFDELKEIVIQSGHSRIPVYEDDLDNVVGIIYAKDLLDREDWAGPEAWVGMIRKPFFVPETKKIDDLLKEIQSNRKHLAVVIDEYGGTLGIITLEDILEEVVGDIIDEFDKDIGKSFKKVSDNTFIFDGKTMIIDCCKRMNIPPDIFEEARGESDSLGGLVLELFGKFPEEKETISYKSYNFTVLSRQNNRIEKVKITRKVETPKENAVE